VRWRLAAIDVGIAALAFAASATVLLRHGTVAGELRQPDALAYVLLAGYSGSVALRRRLPEGALVLALVTGVAYAALTYPEALTLAGLLPVYTAAAVLPPVRSRVLLAASVVLGWLGTTFSPGPTDPAVPAVILCAWLLGTYVGSRRAYTAELERKNRLLEQAQLELADRAVAQERLRIARELHDVVAHTMTVVAMHAGTGRMVAEDDPAAARQALATVETVTRSALVEMRRLLDVLRSPTGDPSGRPAPTPGLADVDSLVTDLARSGVKVGVSVEGERGDVPAGVDLSAYRIVQEALTNVLKHAPGSGAAVSIRYEADAVTVEVVDDGPVGRGPGVGPGKVGAPPPGHGLVGMRERVALYDGRLEAGARPSGGFRVCARLPREAHR
jgi:signal transduction histidine kinase